MKPNTAKIADHPATRYINRQIGLAVFVIEK
jgi:hypothetical protein